MTDIDAVLAAIKPATRTVPICLDGTLAEQHEQAVADWIEARDATVGIGSPEVVEARQRILDLEGDVEAATVVFTITNIGRTAWRKLVSEHPPPADDLEGWRWDPDTFPVAALAAACLDPVMDEIKADALALALSEGQFQKLLAAVLEVNAGDDIVPKFAPATAGMRSFEPLSTTADLEASPSPSSSETG